jgi:plasmid stabilization system protein ParE
MKINYSLVAQEEYIEILYYLADKFGEQKAIKFEEDFVSNLEQLQKFPESFGGFYETNKRKFMINKNISVIYKINEISKTIEILNFWFNRSNPEVVLQHL